MNSGKRIRLARLFQRASGRSIIVPMDHGATMGPLDGITDLCSSVIRLQATLDLVQGIVLHRGAMSHLDEKLMASDVPPRILHLSGGTAIDPAQGSKSLVAQVEDALQIGADAVSVQVNLGVDGEGAMLRDLGAVASACGRWSMPLLAMMYVRTKGMTSTRTEDVKLAARVAAETGADLVKVSHPGSVEAMREVVDGCFVPVLVAGGERANDPAGVAAAVRSALDGGAAGICVGRNTFQAPSPSAMLRTLAELVHGVPQRVAVPPSGRQHDAPTFA